MRGRKLPLLVLFALLCACSSARQDAERLTRAPNVGISHQDLIKRDVRHFAGLRPEVFDYLGWKVGYLDVGDGEVLSYWRVDPPPIRRYVLPSLPSRRQGKGVGLNDIHPAELPAKPKRIATTAVILHGLFGNKFDMSEVALACANAGYRAIVVDLPGHGASTGNTLTFGASERLRLADAIRQLRSSGEVSGHLVLMGVSMGASIALMTAADGVQVDAIVAVSPYAEVGDAFHTMAIESAGLYRWFVRDEHLERIISEVEAIAGAPRSRSSPVVDVGNIACPVLILHGQRDTWIPIEHAYRLEDRGRDVRVIPVPMADHLSIAATIVCNAELIAAWVDQQLGRRVDPANQEIPPP
jgi:pimeloyl-ACP methyl ester carboxylesterase